MTARLVVFPIRGRSWCFSRSADVSVSASASSSRTPSTLKELWKTISRSDKTFKAANAEIVVDFVATKMNNAWMGLEKAPDGSMKSKLHGLGLRLLSRVKPSEIFLKSISKEVTRVEVIYPSSLNARLVRRRLRHMAMSVSRIFLLAEHHIILCGCASVFLTGDLKSLETINGKKGTIIHRKYLYGSISFLPLASSLAVLPLPNVVLFWNLFRAYSHWRALQGSEKLFQLVSDTLVTSTTNSEQKDCRNESHNSHGPYWAHPRSLLAGFGTHKPTAENPMEALTQQVSALAAEVAALKASRDKGKSQESDNYQHSKGHWREEEDWEHSWGNRVETWSTLAFFLLEYVLQPSKELEHLLHDEMDETGDLSQCAIKKICKIYDLNTNDVLKYKRLH
ncbi:K+-H+ exchange-like protein [Senna tora]|uniref:K+-H+ exchange-like protein n=1 Tax=Senna tora TaxID=362788 RepID=A0A834XEN5_9FABA|nr:K+-H+ exchange-like protein [Senna tora]